MLPDDAKAIEITSLFEGELSSLPHHCWQMTVKAQVRLDDRPGMNWPKLDDEFDAGDGVEKQSKKNYKKNIAFRNILGDCVK